MASAKQLHWKFIHDPNRHQEDCMRSLSSSCSSDRTLEMGVVVCFATGEVVCLARDFVYGGLDGSFSRDKGRVTCLTTDL